MRLGHRHPARDRHGDDPHRPVPQGPRREHARCPGGRPGRQDALRRQRRQQLRRRRRRRHAEPQPGQGLHPHRLVSDRRGGHARTARSLLVGVGKGNQTKANPIEPVRPKTKTDVAPVAKRRALPFPYIGTTLSGSLSIVPVPDDKALAQYTETVYKNCPYSDKLLTDAPHPEKTAIPTKVGDPSPIKYVLYIIKENRTYDQVFGDMPRGNGDPSLVMFGREVTPNHHKLAEEFVLLDNLYCNGHVSADGHPWSTMAYNTDYIARNWALTYSSRTGIHDDDEGDLSNAPSGYLWDACSRAGLGYRSYGEYGRRVSQPDGSLRVEGAVPGLVGHMCPDYGVAKVRGGRVRDTDNAETFLREFREFEKNGNLPRFMVMSLGEDHTTGTRPGTFTPRACVASNDLALGRIVEAVTHSKHWPEIAIFVIEDDAQNGPDHVDAHRTVGLVISPYTKRKYLDSTQYSTVSMIRTMELILGLPPLSQYDAAARPMFASFTDKPDLTPYTHEPARIDLNEVNSLTAYGAERSLKMDFDEYDRIDDFELNEILWRVDQGQGRAGAAGRAAGDRVPTGLNQWAVVFVRSGGRLGGRRMDDREVGAFWEGNAETWTMLSRLGCNLSRDEITMPAFLSMLPDVSGLTGLDIGCGDGHSTRLIAARGARMTAVDIAPTFIRLAREEEEREPLGIDYRVASALELPFPDGVFDFVVAFMSLMDIPQLHRALSEACRVLRSAGFLQFAITHPCYDTPERGWVRNEAGQKVAFQCGGYFDNIEGRVDEWLFFATPAELKHRFPKFQTPKYFRTLSTWLNSLRDAGFVLEQVQEPRCSDVTLRRFPDFADARIVPLWLNIRSRKPA